MASWVSHIYEAWGHILHFYCCPRRNFMINCQDERKWNYAKMKLSGMVSESNSGDLSSNREMVRPNVCRDWLFQISCRTLRKRVLFKRWGLYGIKLLYQDALGSTDFRRKLLLTFSNKAQQHQVPSNGNTFCGKQHP